jgi:hypothetical protein
MIRSREERACRGLLGPRRYFAIGAALVGLISSGSAPLANFSGCADSAGSFATAADWTAPTVSSAVISKTPGYLGGKVRQSSPTNLSYYIYANVSDSGNPASGVSTVTANVSNITSGSASVSLASGSYSVEGVSYNYRSSSTLNTNSSLSAGSKTFTITATDSAGNTGSATSFSVTVDNTAPTGSDIQATNGTGQASKADAGDVITYSTSEQLDPQSILSGWTGSSTSVQVKFTNSGSSDLFAIWNSGGSTQLALGSVNTNANHVGTSAATFNATMAQSATTITVTLGSLVSGSTNSTSGSNTMEWTPSSSAYDAAGVAMSTSTTFEGGSGDPDF